MEPLPSPGAPDKNESAPPTAPPATAGPVVAGPPSLGGPDRARRRRTIAAMIGGGALLFLISFSISYSWPAPPPSLALPSALPIPKIRLPSPCASGLPCPEPDGMSAEGKARYFDDGEPPAPAPSAPRP